MNKGFENIEKAQKNVSAYIILDKEKNVFGRIIARSTKNRVCHLTFNIFRPDFSCFYRRARGCGYNKILHSMSSILGDKEVREKLESVGFKFYDNCYEWKSLFESNGFTVIYVI